MNSSSIFWLLVLTLFMLVIQCIIIGDEVEESWANRKYIENIDKRNQELRRSP